MKSFANISIAGVAFWLICSVNAQAQMMPDQTDSLTIHQAIGLALKNQPALEQLDAEIDAARAQVDQAKSGEYPQVGIEGSYNHVDPVSSFQLDPNQPALDIEPHNNIDAHLAAHQVLYDFGQTKANIALARSKTLTAKQRTEVTKWTISYFTVQTFYAVLYLQKRIDVQQQQIKTLKEDLKLAQTRFKNGTATKYDVLSLQVRIAEENNTQLDLINQKQKMIIQLRKLFGWPADRPVLLQGSLEMASEKPAVNPAQIKYSLRPDYEVLQKQKKTAEQLYKLKDTGDRPVISAGGTAGFKNGYIKNLDRLFGNWSVGLNVRVPLFNGFKTDYEKQEARAQVQSLNAQTVQLQRTIDSQVQQAYADVQTAVQKLSTSDLQIKQAKEQLRLAKLRYRKGVVTNTDLLTSETALARARLEKVTAQYHILVNQYQLRKAAGQKIWESGL